MCLYLTAVFTMLFTEGTVYSKMKKIIVIDYFCFMSMERGVSVPFFDFAVNFYFEV